MNTYTDRKGRVWYLKHSLTKTGKDRWTASKDEQSGTNATSMPAGYEFHENVNAQVFVRKKRVSKLLPAEVALVEEAISKLHIDCRLETTEKAFVVYASDFHQGPKNGIEHLLRSFGDPLVDAQLRNVAHFSPMMRFVLVNAVTREFRVDRMSFHGEPDWWTLGFDGKLEDFVKTFLPLLDDPDAFFECV